MQSRPENASRESARITIKRSIAWEIVGFFAMLAALLIVVLVGNWQWSVFVMLFAIYCAVMR